MRAHALIFAVPLLAGVAVTSARAQGADPRGAYDQGGYRQGGYAGGDQRGQGQYRDSDDGGRAGPPSGTRPAGGADYADADQAPPDLGRDLGLRPDQRSALLAYQQGTTPSEAEQQQTQGDLGRLRTMTTPERLEFTARQMQREQADFSRRAMAVRRFYGQLTAQQQRRFDELTGPGQDNGQDNGSEGAQGR